MISLLLRALEVVLHIDRHLAALVQWSGHWSYAVLWLVIFAETGLVITPFLPGDSFLFAIGALCASGVWKIGWIWLLLCSAAIIGDSVNYALGKALGSHLKTTSRLFGATINPSHLKKTEDFYAKYGTKAIVLARFAPIIRTFAPFVAGMGNMHYKTFLTYNIIGGITWVSLLTGLGYFFGNLPIIKERFGIVVIAIIIISLIPIGMEYRKERKKNK